MLLQPKSLKYKKYKKGKLSNYSFKSKKLKFGNIGLKALESGVLTARQLESARQAINRKINRKGKLWIRVYPCLPITSKPSESRMGKGKGSVSHWAVKVRAGQFIFEICGITYNTAILAFKAGRSKLPFKTNICY
jgi:large subunit ribosomal protein L16